MSSEKYIGMDVHQATISVAVLDSQGKTIMESILETKASTLLEFLGGLRGTLYVTFEEGTWAAWLYDLLASNHHRLPVSGSASSLPDMQLRWNAESAPLESRKPKPAHFFEQNGLEAKEPTYHSSRRRKTSLTLPSYRSASAQACAFCSRFWSSQ